MKILFIFAHPDDEAYGPAGTIAKLSTDNEVVVVSACNGARPGSEHVSGDRMLAFKQSCETLGATSECYHTPDCALTYDETLSLVEYLIKTHKPDVVYTNNISDIHRDHRLVAECCMVACRPKPDSTVKQLYFCEMPASTSWSFNQIEPTFKPTVYEDVSDYIAIKTKALSLYKTELYEFPDARSVEATEVLARYRGFQSGFKAAEAFQLVFSLSQRTQ